MGNPVHDVDSILRERLLRYGVQRESDDDAKADLIPDRSAGLCTR